MLNRLMLRNPLIVQERGAVGNGMMVEVVRGPPLPFRFKVSGFRFA